MKQKSLLFSFLVLFSFFSGTHAWGQDRTVSSEEELSDGLLTDVVNLKLSGSWNSANIQSLMKALHPNGNYNSSNITLKTVTYADAAFTGGSLSLQDLFRNCTSLTSVELPDYSEGVVGLSYAFYNCSSLLSINSETPKEFDLTGFSGGINNVSGTFAFCSLAVSIKFPANLSSAANFATAFNRCTSLSRINSETPGEFNLTAFSGGISNLQSAFGYCSKVVSIQLPVYSVAVDLSFAFSNCSSLSRINSQNSGEFDLTGFSGGISNLYYAFSSCSQAVSIKLPVYSSSSSAIDLGYAFFGCSSLLRINSQDSGEFDLTGFSGGISNMGSAFLGCSQAVSIKLPANSSFAVNFISAFSGCSSLLKINSDDSGEFDLTGFSGGISYMENTFSGCSQAVSIKLPVYSSSSSAVTLSSAFRNCSSLRFIRGLEGYTNASGLNSTFENCYSLSSVELGSIPVSSTSSTFKGTNPNCLKFLPESSTIPANWSDYSNFIIGSQSKDNITLSDRSGSAVPGEAGFNPFDCPREFTIAPGCSITYTRPAANLQYATSSGGWNTLVLPFDATLKVGGTDKMPVTTTQNGDYWLRSFVSASTEGEVTFADTQDGLVRANVPYLLALPGSSFGDDSMQGKDAIFTSAVSSAEAPVTVKASADVDYSAHENFSYRGVFTPLVASSAYLLTSGSGGSGDSFVKYTEGNASSFRAYFAEVVADGQPSGVRQLRIGDGGSVTSLSPVTMEREGDSLTPRKVWTKEGLRIIKGNLVYSVDGALVGELEGDE